MLTRPYPVVVAVHDEQVLVFKLQLVPLDAIALPSAGRVAVDARLSFALTSADMWHVVPFWLVTPTHGYAWGSSSQLQTYPVC